MRRLLREGDTVAFGLEEGASTMAQRDETQGKGIHNENVEQEAFYFVIKTEIIERNNNARKY